MKILIASDSFKDCLTAHEVGESLKKGLQRASQRNNVRILPMADGGEGTVQALVDATNGEIVSCEANDALMRPIKSFYGILGDKETAVIEMAAASGIEHLKVYERNAWLTSTKGTGQLILNALNRGCKRIIIGIGGSATNDGGVGMAAELGVKFLDAKGNAIAEGGGALSDIVSIDISEIDRRVNEAEFIVACDVENPLTGKDGASAIYGPQKGADEEMVAKLDSNLKHYAKKVKEFTGHDVEFISGSGAAGGLGAGLMAFCNGQLRKGIDIVAQECNLKYNCEWADIVITGEGKIDGQTKFGKTPQGVANMAKSVNVPVVAVAGTLGEGYEELYNTGFNAIFSIVDAPMNLSEALLNAPKLLENAGLAIGNFLQIKK